MKVLMINGSPHKEGNVYLALREMEQIFRQEDVETEIVHIGNQAIRGCVACYSCKDKGKCVFNDLVNQVAPKFEQCDGLSATFDELNKYFFISGMPVAAGQYWNSVHGREIGEAAQDVEGMQGMRTLARNMVFLMRSINLGKEKYGLPEREAFTRTNFIR